MVARILMVRPTAALVLLCSAGLRAQPAFEVASIKPHDIFKPDQRKWGLSISGTNVFFLQMRLMDLIMAAYGVESYQVTGGPRWVSDSIGGVYDITAKAGGEASPSKEQALAMLQTLLADRFRLQVRRDTKELPVYELIAAKRGTKLRESALDSAFSNHQSSTGQTIKMAAVHNTVAQLVNAISPYCARPVIDETGLTKAYDFAMEFVSERASGPPSDLAGPAIGTALEEQLGLKLEPQKRPMDILVIDRAERPSEN
jgi:uncharacterized protein (TIGR03435 family)